MRNWKIPLLILVIAIGGAFEFLKSGDKFRLQDETDVESALNKMDWQPYSRSQTQVQSSATPKGQNTRQRAKSVRIQRPQLAQANQKTIDHSPEKKAKGKADKEKTDGDKEDQEKEECVPGEPNENGEIELECPEEDEEKENETETADHAPHRDLHDDSQGQGDSIESADDAYVGGESAAQIKQEESDSDSDIPVSLEEWAELLLKEPNFKETNRFIDFYQSNLVSADIFYEIINRMLSDTREKMQDLGIHALNSTPSYRSFTTLVDLYDNNQTISRVRSKAESTLYSAYNDLTQLYILKSVFTVRPSNTALRFAAQILKSSAERYLTAETQNQQATNDQPRPLRQQYENPASTSTRQYQHHFTGFIQVLEQAVQSSDASASAAVEDTLSTIQRLISS